MRRTFIFLIILSGLVYRARAQNTEPAKLCYWLNGQLGSGTYELYLDAEAGISLRENYMFAVKLATNGNIGRYRDNGRHSADLAAAIFGKKITHGKQLYLTASAGIGVVYFEQRGDAIDVNGTPSYGPGKTFNCPGVPLELKLWSNPLPFFGFTAAAGATFTTQQTMAHISFGMTIGKLRRMSMHKQ